MPNPGGISTQPVIWLSADSGVYSDAGSTLATNGQTCQQWNNQGSLAQNAVQATSGQRPTYVTNALNGLPILRFASASSKNMTISSTDEPRTIFAVVKNTASTKAQLSAFSTICGAKGATVALDSWYFEMSSTAPVCMAFTRCTNADTDGSTLELRARANQFSGSWYVQTGVISGTNMSLYFNNQLVASDTTASTLRTITGPVAIGAAYYNHNLVNYANGDFAEIIIFNTALNLTDQTTVYDYLVAKYALPTYLQDPNPYVMVGWRHGASLFLESAYMMTSADRLTWNTRYTNLVPGSVDKICRDTCMMPTKVNGTYYMSYLPASQDNATFAGGTKLTVASTPDLLNWTDIYNFDTAVSVPGTTHHFPGNFFVDIDGTVHFYSHVSTNSWTTFTTYVWHQITPGNFTSWDGPYAVTGTGFQPDFIDWYILYDNGTYHGWMKAIAGYIYYSTSSTPWSGWATPVAITKFGLNTIEGELVYKTSSTNFRMVVDRFNDGGLLGLHYTDTTTPSDPASWSALTALTMPFASGHGDPARKLGGVSLVNGGLINAGRINTGFAA